MRANHNMLCRFLLVLLLPALLELFSTSPAACDETPDYYRNLGAQLFEQKRFTDSITAFDHAIKLSPRTVNLYNERAAAYKRCNQYKQASADMQMAITLEPKNVEYCLTYAGLGKADGNSKQEIEGYTRCLALEPENVYVLVERARAYRSIRDFDHSLQDYNSAFAVLPATAENKDDLGDMCRELGLLWLHRKDYARAISDFNNGLKYKPSNMAIIRNRADAYAGAGQEEKAVQDLSRCISQESRINSRMDAVRRRGQCYVLLKNYPKALADANQLIEADHDDVDALMMRAKIYAEQGKSDLEKKDRAAIAKYQEEMAPPKE